MVYSLNEDNNYIPVGSISIDKFEEKKLNFAKKILLFIFILILIGIAVPMCYDIFQIQSKETANSIFDTFKTD